MANILSHKYVLIFTFNAKLLGFEHIKDLYANDRDFVNVFNTCKNTTFGKFYRHKGFLFRRNQLYVPKCS